MLVASPTLSPEDIDLIAKGSAGGPSAAYTLNQVSSKADAIEFLQNLKKPYYGNGIMISPSDSARALSNLGHRQNLERLYNAYLFENIEAEKARIFVHGIKNISTPVLLAVMGDDVNKDGEKVHILTERLDVGYDVPFANAYTILRIVETSKFFSPDVVSWAKNVSSRYGSARPNLYLSDVRSFWAQNGAFIKAEEYSRVRPPKTGLVDFPQQPMQPATLASSAVAPEKVLLPVKSTVAASIPTPAAAPESAAKTNPVWWIIGLIILAAGVVFATRKKGPKA